MRAVRQASRVTPCAAALLAAGVFAYRVAAVRGADPQAYHVVLAKTGQADLDAALAASSSLIALRKTAPVGPFALVVRAEGDAGRLATALHSFGYYKGVAHITIDDRVLDDPTLPAALDALPPGSDVAVDVAIDRGPLFHLGHVALTGEVPADVQAKFPLAAGQPAIAANVLAAQGEVLTALQDDGYALAKVADPVAIEHPDSETIDVTYAATAGPKVDIGPITLKGLKGVNRRFVQDELLLHPGEQYSPETIEKARQALASLGVFSSVRATPADAVDAAGTLPVVFTFVERPKHVVDIGASYSTDLGGAVTASWTDRNLFGSGEVLTFSAAATELGGSDAKQPGYNLEATFTKPDFLRRDQSLVVNAGLVKEYLDTYDRTAALASVTLNRQITPFLTASLGVDGEQERVTQEGVTRDYTLVGLPIGVKFDNTGSLFEPIHGYRAQASVTPTESFGGYDGSTTFVLLQAGGSTYLDFGSHGRSVLALRALLGLAEGASSVFELPPDQRFYAGGSATIRGYKYQYVGPHFPDNHPTGGTSLDTGTIEFRQRFGKSFGAAVFLDAGQVGTNATPFEGPFRAGAGIGARYYTAIGPIRVDFAVPLIKQAGNDAFEVYIGIGEAF